MRIPIPCAAKCEYVELCATCHNGHYVLARDMGPNWFGGRYKKGDTCLLCGGSGETWETVVDDEETSKSYVSVGGEILRVTWLDDGRYVLTKDMGAT
jgi:hypothetical protein